MNSGIHSKQEKQRSRSYKRSDQQIRPLHIEYNMFGYAAASVIFELGNTKVLCSVTMQQGVPSFLRGKGSGWLTAEYAMLPTATATRTTREITTMKRSGRAVEISRLIGRVLRSIVNLDSIGERTITVDCDVLQADGGTRTASINGAYLALKAAENLWLQERHIQSPLLLDMVAAVSVGVSNGSPLVDPDFEEDSTGDADFNFVLTKSGNVIEIQGGVEKRPISQKCFQTVQQYAFHAINDIFLFFDTHMNTESAHAVGEMSQKLKAPFFSLKNRNIHS